MGGECTTTCGGNVLGLHMANEIYKVSSRYTSMRSTAILDEWPTGISSDCKTTMFLGIVLDARGLTDVYLQ